MNDQNRESRRVILEKVRLAIESDNFPAKEDVIRSSMKNKECTKVEYVSNLEKFISKLEKSKATVSIVNSKSEIIREIDKYNIQYKISSAITIANEPNFTALDWEGVDVTTEYEPTTISTSVTFAWVGIEEIGALVLASSPSTPTGMNFLPDHHFIVLDSDKIVKTMEDVWTLLKNKGNKIPRTINLISGPSRTADIEYKIQIGAHGPKSLHVIIIKDD